LRPGIEQLQALTGVRPVFYRAPGLNWSKRVLAALGPLGLCPISQLLFGGDYRVPRKNAQTLCRAFQQRLEPGHIVILHLCASSWRSRAATRRRTRTAP